MDNLATDKAEGKAASNAPKTTPAGEPKEQSRVIGDSAKQADSPAAKALKVAADRRMYRGTAGCA